MARQMAETDLYQPIKGFLEKQGYEVKGEIGAVDVMAVRGQEPPLLVEMKRAFSLGLIHQGVARLAISDLVYLVVPYKAGRASYSALKKNIMICRRLGLGVMTVRLSDGLVQVHCDPGPYQPRKSVRKKGVLLKEFAKREGDPSLGGATRDGLVTAYRQDAEKIRAYLQAHGASRGAVVAKGAGVPKATNMMRDNHYGWFENVSRGLYQLKETPPE